MLRFITIRCRVSGGFSVASDRLAHVDYHQIPGDHERSFVFFAYRVLKPFLILVVINDTKLGLHNREYASRIFGRRNCPLRFRSWVLPASTPGSMKQAVCALGEIHKVLTKLRV